uniref:Clathrin light chain n=1 Tax=Bubo bubo TaxID=30461 RepID=A0A8C0EM56_BUBBB
QACNDGQSWGCLGPSQGRGILVGSICPRLSPSLPPILACLSAGSVESCPAASPLRRLDAHVLQESNGPTDAYAAIAKADRLTQEPESIRKWREEQKKRLEELDAASKVTEQEWREKAKKDLEEWNLRQNEQMEKNRANNRIADKAFYQQPDADVIGYVYVDNPQCVHRASEEAFLKESKEESPGSEWEKVAQLCDFNPKSSKQSKDVSRMRSVLISLKQTPLSR